MRITLTQIDSGVSLTLAAVGTIPWPVRALQRPVTAAVPAISLDPTGVMSLLVTVTADTTLDILPGYAGQALRLEVRQDNTGGHDVSLGSSIVIGADVPAFTPSIAPGTRDLLQLIAADATHWMLVAVNHGFGV